MAGSRPNGSAIPTGRINGGPLKSGQGEEMSNKTLWIFTDNYGDRYIEDNLPINCVSPKWTAYVPASELEELKAAILDLEQKMKFGVGHYDDDDCDDAIELLADKARQVGGNDPGTVRFKYTEKPTQEGES